MLYKYLTADRAINILRKSKIRISQLDALNDPYECEPAVRADFILNLRLPFDSESNLQELADKISGSRSWIFLFNNESAYDSFVSAYKVFPELVLRLLAGRRDKEQNIDLETSAYEELMKAARLNSGVFSASKCWDSLLMWAHYADEHRGVVFGFDENAIFGNDSTKNSGWKKVGYSKDRVVVDVADSEAMRRFLSEKPAAWKYEREYRLIKFLHDFDKDKKRHNGLDVFLMDIYLGAIKEVYFGSRIEKLKMERVFKLARKKCKNARILKTGISRKSYKLNRYQVKV